MKNNQNAPRIKDPSCEDTKDLLVTEFVFPSKLGLELHEDLLKAPRIKDPNYEDTYQNVNISLFEAGKVNDNAEYNPGLLGDSDSGQ